MERFEENYDGRNVNEMAPYAHIMGQVNSHRLSKLERLDMWWDSHPKTKLALGILATVVMVGIAIHHMLTF